MSRRTGCRRRAAGWRDGSKRWCWAGARRLHRAHPDLVRGGVRRAHTGPGRRLAGDRRRAQRAGGGTDRLRQDPVRLLVVPRPTCDNPATRRQGTPLPGALRLAAQGTGRRRRAQPPRSADRHRPHVRPTRGARTRHHGRAALGRHHRRGPPPARHDSPRHPHHHPRVAVLDADLAGARDAARRRDRDRRRGPRGGRHQARRAPRAVPGASRRAATTAGPRARTAHRAVGDGPAGGGGRTVPRRQPPGRGGRAGVGQAVGPLGGRAGRGHDRARARRGARRRARGVRRRQRGATRVDLAARRGAGGRPHLAAPLDDRVRQLPAARGAADRALQRDRHRTR